MSEKLLHCPCGNKPYITHWSDKSSMLTVEKAQVRCDCGFSGAERYGDNCKAEAIKAWNHHQHRKPVSANKLADVMLNELEKDGVSMRLPEGFPETEYCKRIAKAILSYADVYEKDGE